MLMKFQCFYPKKKTTGTHLWAGWHFSWKKKSFSKVYLYFIFQFLTFTNTFVIFFVVFYEGGSAGVLNCCTQPWKMACEIQKYVNCILILIHVIISNLGTFHVCIYIILCTIKTQHFYKMYVLQLPNLSSTIKLLHHLCNSSLHKWCLLHTVELFCP